MGEKNREYKRKRAKGMKQGNYKNSVECTMERKKIKAKKGIRRN